MAEYVQVITTVPTKDEGTRVARALLERRLVGCVQIVGPIESAYWWQGRIEQSQEWLCIAKTERGFFAQIEEVIKAVHSYKVPEILAVPVSAGSRSYLEWLTGELHAHHDPA